ncbi:MAG TPA: 50S ribosomal protein L4 [Limnochordia bacterium]|nr:50S ribosomal protein L4 [Limnochordia bacterium]
MPHVPFYDKDGNQTGEVELNEKIFAAPANEPLLHQAVVMYLANRRVGTVATKNRSAVRGGGRKPWRQKGTGRARHGSIRSPLWKGGGVVFGPQPREHRQSMPKKARRQALRIALSSKVAAGELIVIEQFELAEPKTKVISALLDKLASKRKPLIITRERETNLELSARNLPGSRTMLADDLNAYEVLAQGRVVLTRAGLERIQEMLA